MLKLYLLTISFSKRRYCISKQFDKQLERGIVSLCDPEYTSQTTHESRGAIGGMFG